ncbi:NADH-ubiquinone oxidoreductase 30.4 kDa subunit [Blastomyces gilchristii SLH14081]|uniref:NADH-ubiquinone oxidoreductase 30.4 kDa subunit n=1 Tax=Blastomyces gilchristii (strain SLH14081) TaxID=559298 RepID=A0A179UEM2_BLAGS|nr:NADH-ubiquinone oxidoreductase 30.4 kDa subunit [Blastomyces gilchristii SLH14081]OAT05738.1 NADH-ubiquinone oxidoreductase 30.4 kDa subunit [Blastomyces gilchristii SLH14081]
MSKRKRGDYEKSDISNPDDRRLGIQSTRLEQKIEHGCQLIHRALKTARGFERQKLGRRQKTATETNETAQLSRIEEEIQALKGLDLGVTAERHLLKHLAKTKRIAESPAFSRVAARKPLPEGPKNGPEANVVARLFKSNPVRDVLPGILSGIRQILGLGDGVLVEKSRTRETTPPITKRLSAVEEESRSNRQQANGHENDLAMEDADMEQYNARLASSSESESGSDEEGGRDNDNGFRRNSARYEPSLSPTPSTGSSASISKTKTKPSKSNNKNPETTFLPSLTLGGYWSGSESADEDAAAAGIQPRKNRMGQQARRKLWEKKFGSGANHLKNQPPEKEKSRDSGWDMRKGATARDKMRGRRGRGGFAGGMSSRRAKVDRVAQAPNPNFEQLRPRPAPDQKPLHPSWEAAKKAKEQKSNAAFQGKKVVFD